MCKDIVKLLDPDSYFIQVDIKFAEKYGLNEAILAGKMMWLEEKLQGLVDDDGIKWVRLTTDEWIKEVPFFSKNTIRRAIVNLEQQKIFLTTTFTGRSKWYRLNPLFTTRKHKVSTQNGQIHYDDCPKWADTTTQNGQLPIIQSYIKNKEGDSPTITKKITAKVKPLAVHVYRSVVHLWPHASLYETIDNIVGDKPEDIELWEKIVLGWIAMGWNPKNTRGMLDFFERKEIPGSKKETDKHTQDWTPEQLEKIAQLDREYKNETNGKGFETTEADIDAKIDRIQRERNLELQSMREND